MGKHGPWESPVCIRSFCARDRTQRGRDSRRWLPGGCLGCASSERSWEARSRKAIVGAGELQLLTRSPPLLLCSALLLPEHMQDPGHLASTTNAHARQWGGPPQSGVLAYLRCAQAARGRFCTHVRAKRSSARGTGVVSHLSRESVALSSPRSSHPRTRTLQGGARCRPQRASAVVRARRRTTCAGAIVHALLGSRSRGAATVQPMWESRLQAPNTAESMLQPSGPSPRS